MTDALEERTQLFWGIHEEDVSVQKLFGFVHPCPKTVETLAKRSKTCCLVFVIEAASALQAKQAGPASYSQPVLKLI